MVGRLAGAGGVAPATQPGRAPMFESGLAATLELHGSEDAYPTRIEEVRGDYLLVETPMRQGEYVRLEPSQRLMLSVIRRNSPYFFETTVVGTEFSERQQLTMLRRPSDADGVALRQAVRVPVTISDGLFWWEGPNGKFGPSVPGQLVDLSAGGMQVVTKGGLPSGTLVLARFRLSRELGHVMLDAQVVRDYERTSEVGVTWHRSHCQFVDLPPKDQDRLIKLVFQRERELRQRGVL
jgi:c-di-GMP-binding flagellar brake protein YcgR